MFDELKLEICVTTKLNVADNMDYIIEWSLLDRCRIIIEYAPIGDLIGWAEIQYLACGVTYVATQRYEGTYGAGGNV